MTPEAHARVRYLTTEEIRPDEAGRNLAARFAPDRDPPEGRRFLHRDASRDWPRPHGESERDDLRDDDIAGDRAAVPWTETLGGEKRRRFPGLRAGLVIVAGAVVAFAAVWHLNDRLPTPVGAFSGEPTGFGLGSRVDSSTAPATIATASVAPVAAAAPAVLQPSDGEDPAADGQAEPPVATSARALSASEGEASAAPSEKSQDRVPQPQATRAVPPDPEPVPARPDQAQAEAEAPAPGQAQPVTPTIPSAQADRLLARGEALLQRGDIVSARLVFERVAAAGDRRGAEGVAMTYDPDVFAFLPVAGLRPDREKARDWYAQAGGRSTFTADFIAEAKEVAEQRALLAAAATSPDAEADPGVAPDDAVATPVSQEVKVKPQASNSSGLSGRHAACARKYKSYNPETGLYKSYSGVMRSCRLP